MADDAVATFEMDIEIKCPAQKFFDAWGDHVTMLPRILPHTFRSTKVVKGDGKSVGSVVDWEYAVDPPNFETARQTIEAIDEENMVCVKRFYGGDLGRKFHVYRATLKAFKRGNKSYVKWTLDIKKTHDEVLDPHDYMAFIEKFTKELDAALAAGNVAV